MKTLTVISPVYNEEEVIGLFYQETRKILQGLSARYCSDILFVVDKSSDSTLDILREIATSDVNVRVISMSGRFGHQMALLAGIDHCDSDAVIMLDSDLQHPPDLIPVMLDKFEHGYDVVYTLREDTPDISRFKRVTSKLFYRVVNSISSVPINENAADFRLISRRVAEVFQKQIRERNLFLRGFFGWIGFPSIGIPFKVNKRVAGKSKYSLSRMIRFGLSGVLSFSKSPLQAASIFGFIFAGLGFLFAIVTVTQFIFSGEFPSGWTTLVVLVSIFSGIQLLCLGIIGEYIGAIFDEVKARPHYIIEETVNF